MWVKVLVILLKYINTYVNVGYIIPTCVEILCGKYSRYLNFVRKFPTQCRKIPTNLENIATHFIFVRNFPTQCRKIPTNSETDQNVTTRFYIVQDTNSETG